MRPLLIAILVALPGQAGANVADVVDIGTAIGKVGAVAATADGGIAAYYNPAGLAFRDTLQLRIGGEMIRSELRVRNQRVPISKPFGLLIEAATPVPLIGRMRDKLAVGVALHIIPDTALFIDGPALGEAFLPYYQNRSQRLLAVPALAFRPVPHVAFGIGMNYFAGLDGVVRVTEGVARDLQADVEEEFYARAAPHFGMRVELEDFTFAFAYRGSMRVPFSTSSANIVSDTAFSVDIRGDALFTPETYVIAAAVTDERWVIAADVSWRRWSEYPAPYSQVAADASLPLGGGQRIVVHSRFDEQLAQDIFRLAVSGHRDLGTAWRLAAGYAYEPSPFVEQPGITNLIDGNKQMFGLGLTWRGPSFGRVRWAIDFAGQAQWMKTRRLVKDPNLLPDEDPSLPGRQTYNEGYPTVAGGGLVFAAMLSLMVEISPAAAGPESTP